jgi:hypothetical protein
VTRDAGVGSAQGGRIGNPCRVYPERDGLAFLLPVVGQPPVNNIHSPHE